ncbi:MAG: ATP-binding protein [Lachnospiraceae bacterium]|nr:ATP-binding protein [Lachnospiraceae bacterium]
MNKWSVHVENFGKIKKADVEVAPLTFFLGDNNSGKSYIMTLIYGLLNLRLHFNQYYLCTDTEEYAKCASFLESKLNELEAGKQYNFVLTKEEMHSFEALLNFILKENLDKFILELFNQSISIDALSVHFLEDNRFEFLLDSDMDEFILIRCYKENRELRPGYGTLMCQRTNDEKISFFICYILESLLQRDFSNNFEENVMYLPTARTGFLLTYKSIVGQAMYDKFNIQSQEKNLLTRPTGDFLSVLSSMMVNNEKEKFEDIIDFIQREMLYGKISVADLPAHDIFYQPTDSEKSLPMYLSSGVVTELTPIVVFLKYCNITTFLIEEPEISLHPELQWKMAKLLIRLANHEVPVFVTTHSDLIIQHVNNMLKLSKVKEKRESVIVSGYEEIDLINEEKVKIYQFNTTEENQTEIQKIICSDYGFETMTFYNTLKQLSNEIDEIEGYMEEE